MNYLDIIKKYRNEIKKSLTDGYDKKSAHFFAKEYLRRVMDFERFESLPELRVELNDIPTKMSTSKCDYYRGSGDIFAYHEYANWSHGSADYRGQIYLGGKLIKKDMPLKKTELGWHFIHSLTAREMGNRA